MRAFKLNETRGGANKFVVELRFSNKLAQLETLTNDQLALHCFNLTVITRFSIVRMSSTSSMKSSQPEVI